MGRVGTAMCLTPRDCRRMCIGSGNLVFETFRNRPLPKTLSGL